MEPGTDMGNPYITFYRFNNITKGADYWLIKGTNSFMSQMWLKKTPCKMWYGFFLINRD